MNKIDKSDYSEGQNVRHKSFGQGKIVKVQNNMVTIDFEKYGQKTMMKNILNNFLV